MDEKEYLIPDTKSFDEQYGQMMREQLEQLRREKSQEGEALADSAQEPPEETPYEEMEEIGKFFDETVDEKAAADQFGYGEEDSYPLPEEYSEPKENLYHEEMEDDMDFPSLEEEGFSQEAFPEDDMGDELWAGDEPEGEEFVDQEEGILADEEELTDEEEESEEENMPARPRKRRRKRHGCAITIYSVLIIIALVIIANTPLFAVHKINIKGNKDYTKQQVITMSGVQKGDNLFRIQKRSIRKRLVNNSYIREVDLHRSLPDTLTITVKERRAMAYLPYGSKNIVIDSNGYVLKVVNKRPQLVKISDMSIKRMEVGKPIAVSNEKKLNETLEILKLMKQGNLFFKEIKPGQVVMKLCVYDRLVCKGTQNNLARSIKNGTLQGIISDLYKKNVNKGTVNVGHGEYVSFSPKANP